MAIKKVLVGDITNGIPVHSTFVVSDTLTTPDGKEVSFTTHQHNQTDSHGAADTDFATASLHHTIGTTATTAAAGNHTHSGYETANSNIQTHISSTSNPHGTTAAQVSAMSTGHAANSITGFGATGSATTVAKSDQTLYIGTTQIAINRASGSQALTGITSIDGNAANVTGTVAIANGGTGLTSVINGMVKGSSGTGIYSLASAGTDYVTPSSIEALSNKTLTSPKIVNGGYIADANGAELIIFTTTPTAVNEITVANAASGGNPSISATGSGSDISINMVPKGTGTLKVSGTDVSLSGHTHTGTTGYFCYPGQPTSSAIVYACLFTQNTTWAAGAAGSRVISRIAPTGNPLSFSIYKNATLVPGANVTFAIGSRNGVISLPSSVSFVADDILVFQAPSIPDANFSDVFTFIQYT